MKTVIEYSGDERANIDYHHGALRPAVGIHNFQVLRANRDNSKEAEVTGWTYNHAPMLAYWNRKFYLEYLSTPVEEHVPPGHSLLTTSRNGKTWSVPRVVFPQYRIPGDSDGGRIKHAIMHQRMGFYAAPNGRLLILGFYGISPEPDKLPFGERGIGRVVREIYKDDSWGPVYFIRYSPYGCWNEENTHYPFYSRSSDEEFRDACNALLEDKLAVQQWCEEHGEKDDLIPLRGDYQAFASYTLPDGRTAGLWKWSKTGVSGDRGETWDLGTAPTLEMAGAKVWGQKLSDGTYALSYNPTTNNKHRWPLAVVTGKDGLHFHRMLLINGEVPPRRYTGGPFKDFGQNYVRGITEGNGKPPDGAMWLAYSMNKEDIWVSRVPVPIRDKVDEPVDDKFTDIEPGGVVTNWNIYSPLWAPAEVVILPGTSDRCLKLEDRDRYDYARAERVFPASEKVTVEVRIRAEQNSGGLLDIEVWDGAGHIPVRVSFDGDGSIRIHHGRKVEPVVPYEARKWYDVEIKIDTRTHQYQVCINGELTGRNKSYQGVTSKVTGWYFMAPVKAVERLVLRTGAIRRHPNVDSGVDDQEEDLPEAGKPGELSVYYIDRVVTGDHISPVIP